MKVVFIVVVLLLNEPILLIVLVLLLEIALCRVAPGLGFLASQELIDIVAILRLLLSAWGSAHGPLVCESDRLHAKLECAGETDLPHLVSENFSKSGKLLETGRPPFAVSPCADSGWGQSFASMSCRMHWCRCTVTLCVVAEDVVVRVSISV